MTQCAYNLHKCVVRIKVGLMLLRYTEIVYLNNVISCMLLQVFLEDLPEEFAAAVREYNSKIEKNFGCFLLTVAKLADMEQEYQLPLSRIGTHWENICLLIWIQAILWMTDNFGNGDLGLCTGTYAIRGSWIQPT